MQTYIEIILLGYIFSLIFTREFLLCAHGWAERTQLYYWRHISQSEIRNSAAAEKRGRAKIYSPRPQYERINYPAASCPLADSAGYHRVVTERFETGTAFGGATGGSF